MIDRRSFLQGAGALTLGAALSACGRSADPALRVRLLEASIPVQLLKQFQRQIGKTTPLDLTADKQLADLFALLQAWNPQQSQPKPQSSVPFVPTFGGGKAPAVADLITLGDYWLAPAIQQGLIQPFNAAEMAGWQSLDPRWQALVKRDRQGYLASNGEIWGAPYRWGNLVIAYRRDRFQTLGWQPRDWSDLWRPELKERISLLDSPRSVIGLTLKKLGKSVNESDLSSIPNLSRELQTLQQQVKFYSSDAYLQPLLLGDTWAAVGWSTEVLPLLKREHDLAAVVPASGTILTADVWVRPTAASADRTAALKQWVEFYWQPQTAAQLSLLSLTPSPIFVDSRSQAPANLQSNPLLLPAPDLLQHSEFLLPLTDAATAQYLRQWIDLRQKA